MSMSDIVTADRVRADGDSTTPPINISNDMLMEPTSKTECDICKKKL